MPFKILPRIGERDTTSGAAVLTLETRYRSAMVRNSAKQLVSMLGDSCGSAAPRALAVEGVEASITMATRNLGFLPAAIADTPSFNHSDCVRPARECNSTDLRCRPRTHVHTVRTEATICPSHHSPKTMAATDASANAPTEPSPTPRQRLQAAREAAAAIGDKSVEVTHPRKSSALGDDKWLFVCKGVVGGSESVPPILVSVYDEPSDPTAYRVSGLGFEGDRHTLYINVSESMLPGDPALKPTLAKVVLGGVRATPVASPGSGKASSGIAETIALSLDPAMDATWIAAVGSEG